MKLIILLIVCVSLIGCGKRRKKTPQVTKSPDQENISNVPDTNVPDTNNEEEQTPLVADKDTNENEQTPVVAEADTGPSPSGVVGTIAGADTGDQIQWPITPVIATDQTVANAGDQTPSVERSSNTEDTDSTTLAEPGAGTDGTATATVADTSSTTKTASQTTSDEGVAQVSADTGAVQKKDPVYPGGFFENLPVDPRSVSIEDIENSAKVARHNRIGLNANEVYARMQTMPPGLSQEEVDTFWESWKKEGSKISGEEHDVRLAAYQWYRLLNQPPALKWIHRLMGLNPRIPNYVTLHEEFKYFLSKLLLDYKYTDDEVETIPVQSLRIVYHCRVTPNTIKLDDPDLRPSLYVLTEHYELETDKHRCILDVVDPTVLQPRELGDYEDEDYPKWKTIISSKEAPFSCREAMSYIIDRISRREEAKGVPGPYEDYGYRVCEHQRVLFKVDGEFKSLLGPN